MSLRVYFKSVALQESTLFSLPTQSQNGVHDTHWEIKQRFESKQEEPRDWNYCWLNGMRLHWDDELGMPYLEFSHFMGGFPPAFMEIENDPLMITGYEQTRIVDSWIGTQLPGQYTHELMNGRFCAVLKKKEEVCVEIVSSFHPTSSLRIYKELRMVACGVFAYVRYDML